MMAASSGGLQARQTGGSNLPAWTRDGEILFPRRFAGSEVAWKFQPGRPDVDHFNRDYHPELARGGTQICALNPWTGRVTALSNSSHPSGTSAPASRRTGNL